MARGQYLGDDESCRDEPHAEARRVRGAVIKEAVEQIDGRPDGLAKYDLRGRRNDDADEADE
jgi:hypothetical protein